MQKLRKMNDIYIEAQLVIRGLKLLSKAEKKKAKHSVDAKFTLDVPSTKETRISSITRKPEAVAQIIVSAASAAFTDPGAPHQIA